MGVDPYPLLQFVPELGDVGARRLSCLSEAGEAKRIAYGLDEGSHNRGGKRVEIQHARAAFDLHRFTAKLPHPCMARGASEADPLALSVGVFGKADRQACFL
jgi:hypothetical protein